MSGRSGDRLTVPVAPCVRCDLLLVRHARPLTPRPGGPDDYHRCLRQLSERSTSILTSLAGAHPGDTAVVGSHGTFVARALPGFGLAGADWGFASAMPMPAVYRLRFADDARTTTIGYEAGGYRVTLVRQETAAGVGPTTTFGYDDTNKKTAVTPPKVNAAGNTQRDLVYEWDNELLWTSQGGRPRSSALGIGLWTVHGA